MDSRVHIQQQQTMDIKEVLFHHIAQFGRTFKMESKLQTMKVFTKLTTIEGSMGIQTLVSVLQKNQEISVD